MWRAVALVVKVLSGAALAAWVAAAPLVWILRDGLGPGMVETTGWEAVGKFLVGWGGPALAFASPLIVLWLVERRLSKEKTTPPTNPAG